jgi:hypothetical protein
VNSLDPANNSILLPGGWTYPVSDPANATISATVTLEDGGTWDDVNFGWDYQFLPAPSPTTGPTTPSSGGPDLAGLRAVLQGYRNPGENVAQVVAAVQDAVSAFLSAAPQPLTQATADTLADQIRAILPVPTAQQPVAAISDVDGDTRPDLLLALRFMYGFPVFAFLGGENYRGVPLPADYDQDALRDFHIANAWPGGVEARDVTGDGNLEVVATYELPGGSGSTQRVYVFCWVGETKAFDRIFQATLVSWAGSSTWEMRTGPGGSQEFVISGPAFGVFDHKLLPHPTKTQVWQWGPGAGRFVMAEETISQPESLRQQVNVAEALLRQGEYEKAAEEYRRVITDKSLKEEDDTNEAQPNWRAYARLRLGQVYALLGKETEARTELSEAQTAGSTIGQLATAFLDAYGGGDTVVAAWASLINKSNLPELLYEEKAGNLGFPVTAFSVYYPGLAVAAYLDHYPAGASGRADQLAEGLKRLGFDVKSVFVADLSGDGKNDVAFVTPERNLEHAWIAYEREGRWRVGVIAEANEITLVDVRPAAGGGSVVAARFPENWSPNMLGFSWGEDGAISWDLQGDTPRATARDIWPTIGI